MHCIFVFIYKVNTVFKTAGLLYTVFSASVPTFKAPKPCQNVSQAEYDFIHDVLCVILISLFKLFVSGLPHLLSLCRIHSLSHGAVPGTLTGSLQFMSGAGALPGPLAALPLVPQLTPYFSGISCAPHLTLYSV